MGVADGHVIKCSITGKIQLNLLDAALHDVMYVSGLSRRLFSIARFAKYGHFATVKRNTNTLYFGSRHVPITLTAHNGSPIAINIKGMETSATFGTHLLLWSRNRDHTSCRCRISLELQHHRLGHGNFHALLAA